MTWSFLPQVEILEPFAADSGVLGDKDFRSCADAGMHDTSAPESTRYV